MQGWAFSERVEAFLDLARSIDDRRLSKAGIDLSIRLEWTLGAPMRGWIADVDRDDLESFLTKWRQLVTRKEPAHLPSLLSDATTHLTHPRLRELAGQVKDRLELVNRNEIPIEVRPRPAISHRTLDADGALIEQEYTPWEIADVFMHGEIFHGHDRDKKKTLADLEASGFREVAEWIFRQYIVDVVEAMDLTRLILNKAKDKNAVSDEPFDL